MTHGEVSEDCLYLNVWTPAASPSRASPGLRLHLRRRQRRRLRCGAGLRRRGARVEGARGGHVQLSRRRARILRAPRADEGVESPRVRQLRTSRSDRGGQVGARQHRRVRRRSGPGHDRWAVGRRERGPQPDGVAAREGAVPARDRRQRVERRRGGHAALPDQEADGVRFDGGKEGALARRSSRDELAGRDDSAQAGTRHLRFASRSSPTAMRCRSRRRKRSRAARRTTSRPLPA